MFGEDFWKQAVLLLTHCSMDRKTTAKRRQNTGKTDNELAQEFIENLQKKFPNCEGLKYVFIYATRTMKSKQSTSTRLLRTFARC